MPNDPKWRTISRVSKQPITAVLSVYIHLLVIASNATERGRTQEASSEDIASALDLEIDQVEQILSAMQGRVLDGDMLTGWNKRQVEREDGSAERAKAWREAKKAEKQTQANAGERKQTPDKDTDKDKEEDKTKNSGNAFALPDWIDKSQWDLWLKTRKKKMIPEQMQAQVAKLSKWRDAGLDYAKALADAAVNGWQGLQEPQPILAPRAGQSRHVGFDKTDYRAGVNPDGSF